MPEEDRTQLQKKISDQQDRLKAADLLLCRLLIMPYAPGKYGLEFDELRLDVRRFLEQIP